ncbi:MAG: hypothetical protein VB102_03640 [Paludibacter sp.]|nr:hypothetical protein [Paludibacter sp.]
MKLLKNNISASFIIQILLYLFVNILFILKYFPRAGVDSLAILTLYIALFLTIIFLFNTFSLKISERIFKAAFWITLSIMIIFIAVFLNKIDPYSVRVDRWSAVSFFLEGLFNGNYPYGIHTHVSETNYPSPFPVWHFINIPFYLMGDVGIGLIFFLLLTAATVHYFFSSYRKSFLFLFFLFISPAYWWEVAVRSDSLSNAFLIFTFILWWYKTEKTIERNFIFAIIACGLLASTRLSAIIPLAIFFFRPYLELTWKRKLIFILGVLIVIALTFSPFIFWDTTNWVFFNRNPFMSQTSVGNFWVLSALIILGIASGLIWKNVNQYVFITSTFIFIFILASQLTLIATRGINGSVFSDSLYDISYFSLLFPYASCFISEKIGNINV